jgi:hypothetical protein
VSDASTLRTPERFNQAGASKLPGHLGLVITEVTESRVVGELPVATPVHRGRTTQVWDAVVTHKESGRTLALFRCTQMILYTKKNTASTLP